VTSFVFSFLLIARIVPIFSSCSLLLVALKRGHLLISVLESDRSRFGKASRFEKKLVGRGRGMIQWKKSDGFPQTVIP
jgi:hypothetical protein